jgi:hypothetical protein
MGAATLSSKMALVTVEEGDDIGKGGSAVGGWAGGETEVQEGTADGIRNCWLTGDAELAAAAEVKAMSCG